MLMTNLTEDEQLVLQWKEIQALAAGKALENASIYSA